MSRARARLAASAIAVLVVLACSPPGANDEAEDTTDDIAESGEISGNLTLLHDKAGWKPFLSEVVKGGERKLGIDIEQTAYSDTTSYQQVVQSSLPTDDAPDIMTWWSGYRMEDLATAGQLTDLSDLWEEQVAAGNLSEGLRPAFTQEGGVYGVPLHVSYWPVFYNKKVFDRYGLEVPRTWNELIEVADTLVQNGVTPFYATTNGRWPTFIWFEEFIARTDPDFYDRLTDGKESYTDPLVLDAMQEWGEWIEAGYFTDLDLPMDDRMAAEFANGNIAMAPVGTWFNGYFQDAGLKPGVDYDTFILPNRNPDLDENVAVFETSPLAVPANASNPEAAWAFLEWWLQPETQRQWSKQLRDTPVTPDAKAPDAALQSTVDAVEEGDYRLVERYWEASPPPIVEAAVDELARFMLNPDEAEEVLKNMEEIAQQEWSMRGQ